MADNQSPKRTFLQMLGTETVKILVGEDETEFVAHKELLTSSASYFEKAFGTEFKEANEGIIRQPEEHEETIEAFLRVLYGRAANSMQAPESSQAVLVAAYGFAEKICAFDLADELMNIVLGTPLLPEFPKLLRYFNQAPEDSKMRKHLIQKMADRMIRTPPSKYTDRGPPQSVKMATHSRLLPSSYFEKTDDVQIPQLFVAQLHHAQMISLQRNQHGYDFDRSDSSRTCDHHLHSPEASCKLSKTVARY